MTGAPGGLISSSSRSMPPIAFSRACSAAASGASTPIEAPPGRPPIGGLSARRAREPGGATSSHRLAPSSPKLMSLRTS